MLPPKQNEHGVAKQLSFALYSAANRMVRLHAPLLDPHGLTFPQYLVLIELYSSSPRSVGDIGAKLGMEPGTITPLLKRLEVSGFVTRTRDRNDERRVLVDLTALGKSLQSDLWNVSDQVKSACQLSERDLLVLQTSLEVLAWPASADQS